MSGAVRIERELVDERRELGIEARVLDQVRSPAADRGDSDCLVESEQALLGRALGGTEIGSDRIASSGGILQSKDRVVGFEDHGRRGRGESRDLVRLAARKHADRGLVDRVDALGALRETGLAVAACNGLGRRRRDLLPAGERASGGFEGGARLDREESDQLGARRKGKGGVAELPVLALEDLRALLAEGFAVDARSGHEPILSAEGTPRERARRQAELAVGLLQEELRDAAPGALGDEATELLEALGRIAGPRSMRWTSRTAS